MRLPWQGRPEEQSADQLSPKSYLYVSDDKVAMLTEGLPQKLRDRFELKIGVSVGIVNAEVGPKGNEPGRFERAERLYKALESLGLVGDIYQDDKRFVRGTMVATWGFWSRQIEGYADVVFFTGHPDSLTFIALGGSAYHTMARSQDRLQRWSNSGLAALLESIKEQSEPPGKHHHEPIRGAWPIEIGIADHSNTSAPEEIEFVAERYKVEEQRETPGSRAILGSPIYVARTGRPITNQMLRQYAALRRLYSKDHYLREEPSRSRRSRQVGRDYFPEFPPELDPQAAPVHEQ